MPRTNSESSDNICGICQEEIELYAVGKCDHHICYKCSTRMRVLCDQMYCAICRSDLFQVVFVSKLSNYDTIDTSKFIENRKYQILYQNEDAEDYYLDLLDNCCYMCIERPPERNFHALRQHMTRRHELFYCDICVDNLMSFPYERKLYTREELARHRRTGDPDETSHRGHPLCQFCDERYLDNDELLKHLRREHYFCHFCDYDGISTQYYSDYNLLKEHFRDGHYLCEEGSCCRAEFTNAFASQIDFKAHQATNHNFSLKKSFSRQQRTLDIEINYPPRQNRRDKGRGVSREDYVEVREREQNRGGAPSRDRKNYGKNRDRQDRDELFEQAIAASIRESETPQTPDTGNKDDFPSLNNKSAAVAKRSNDPDNMANRLALASGKSVGAHNSEDYPELLGSEAAMLPNKRNNPRQQKVWKFDPIQGDFPALPSRGGARKMEVNNVKQQIKTPPNKPRPPARRERRLSQRSDSGDVDDFPVLAGKPSTLSSIGNMFTVVSKSRSESPKPEPKRREIAPKFSRDSASDFPTLGNGEPAMSLVKTSWAASKSVKPIKKVAPPSAPVPKRDTGYNALADDDYPEISSQPRIKESWVKVQQKSKTAFIPVKPVPETKEVKNVNLISSKDDYPALDNKPVHSQVPYQANTMDLDDFPTLDNGGATSVPKAKPSWGDARQAQAQKSKPVIYGAPEQTAHIQKFLESDGFSVIKSKKVAPCPDLSLKENVETPKQIVPAEATQGKKKKKKKGRKDEELSVSSEDGRSTPSEISVVSNSSHKFGNNMVDQGTNTPSEKGTTTDDLDRCSLVKDNNKSTSTSDDIRSPSNVDNRKVDNRKCMSTSTSTSTGDDIISTSGVNKKVDNRKAMSTSTSTSTSDDIINTSGVNKKVDNCKSMSTSTSTSTSDDVISPSGGTQKVDNRVNGNCKETSTGTSTNDWGNGTEDVDEWSANSLDWAPTTDKKKKTVESGTNTLENGHDKNGNNEVDNNKSKKTAEMSTNTSLNMKIITSSVPKMTSTSTSTMSVSTKTASTGTVTTSTGTNPMANGFDNKKSAWKSDSVHENGTKVDVQTLFAKKVAWDLNREESFFTTDSHTEVSKDDQGSKLPKQAEFVPSDFPSLLGSPSRDETRQVFTAVRPEPQIEKGAWKKHAVKTDNVDELIKSKNTQKQANRNSSSSSRNDFKKKSYYETPSGTSQAPPGLAAQGLSAPSLAGISASLSPKPMVSLASVGGGLLYTPTGSLAGGNACYAPPPGLKKQEGRVSDDVRKLAMEPPGLSFGVAPTMGTYKSDKDVRDKDFNSRGRNSRDKKKDKKGGSQNKNNKKSELNPNAASFQMQSSPPKSSPPSDSYLLSVRPKEPAQAAARPKSPSFVVAQGAYGGANAKSPSPSQGGARKKSPSLPASSSARPKSSPVVSKPKSPELDARPKTSEPEPKLRPKSPGVRHRSPAAFNSAKFNGQPETPVAPSVSSPTVKDKPKTVTYTEPNNFTDRNKKLLENIQRELQDDAERFHKFKVISSEFRQNVISGSDYFTQFVECLRPEGVNKVLPELLVLLPDVSKQQELYSAYMALDTKVKRKTFRDLPVQSCSRCGQVVANVDVSEHRKNHYAQGMPSLGAIAAGLFKKA